MKSDGCLAAGLNQLARHAKRSHIASVFVRKTLQEEPRGRAIVLIGIADLVRVELDLVVVEVEVRSLVEHAIALGILLLSIFLH